MIICGTGHRPNKLGGYGMAAGVKLFNLAYDKDNNEISRTETTWNVRVVYD